jgi:hypothetical protein
VEYRVIATWERFRSERPELAAAGERLLRPHGEGVAFLATTRKDGGPRVHPVMPVLADGRLWVFVVNLSYKYGDLLRDGRFALHALPPTGGGAEFYVTGLATTVDDAERRAAVTAASGGKLGHNEFEVLFELGIERVLFTRWENWGTANAWPKFEKWSAQG